MLPILSLDFEELCPPGIPRGWAFAYHLDKVREAAAKVGENLDGFLQWRIVAGLAQKRITTKLLFWYAPFAETITLTVSERKRRALCLWCSKIPGYFESGSSYVKENASPFVYWDGLNAYRIYGFPPDFDAGQFYVSDLGSLVGITVMPTGQEEYQDIKSNGLERWEYSVIPAESEEIVTVDGRRYVVSHAWWVPGKNTHEQTR